MAGFALVLACSQASGQTARPPTENVTVTGTRSREVLQGFVGSLAVPTRLTGKMTRWEKGICPVTLGLRPQAVAFINRRLKEIAVQAGAPVDTNASCKPNVEIVFTTTPQDLIDNVRKKSPVYLGYYDNKEQQEKLATVTHPIQAWYTTATRDVQGGLLIDNAKPAGLINRMEFPCDPLFCTSGAIELYPPRVLSTTGSRLGDGLRSELHNVIVVADPTKMLDYEIGALSDYISMLVLTEPASQDLCLSLSSILNLLAEGCAPKPNTLTDTDAAFLRGLYKMSPDRTLVTQKNEISYQMEEALSGR